MWSREKVGAAAKEIADQLQVVEHVKALQVAQKELADALVVLGDRIKTVEADMRILKADVKFESLKETQAIVNGVQGHLNQEIKDLAVRLALIEAGTSPTETSQRAVTSRGSDIRFGASKAPSTDDPS